jgi:ABC-type transporter Mla subunit MlaD
VAAVSGALDNLSKASNGLPQTLHDLNALIADLRGASAELGATARSAHNMIDAVAPDVRASAQQLHTITDRLADASGQIDRVIAENRQDLRSFARDGLPELERFLREGRAAAQDIRALANSLRENPAQLIYEPPERGMEIPR